MYSISGCISCVCVKSDRSNLNAFLHFHIIYRLLAKDELVTTLRKCVDILKSGKTKKMSAALQQLEDYLIKFERLDSMFLHVVAILFDCVNRCNYQVGAFNIYAVIESMMFVLLHKLSGLFTSSISRKGPPLTGYSPCICKTWQCATSTAQQCCRLF